MRRWPLTLKVSVYAALLALGTILASVTIFLFVNHRQRLREVDIDLHNNALELLRDLRNFRGAPLDPRHPLSERFIPIALRERHVILTGPEGQILYVSPGYEGTTLGAIPGKALTVIIAGERVRVGIEHEGNYTVELGISLTEFDDFQRDQIISVTLIMPLIGLLIFAGARWLSHRAISSVTALTEAAEHITVENFNHRLPDPPANDEVARLTRVLNDAFARLQASYEAASRFSADASHQMKTPVAVLRLGLELLRKKAGGDETVSKELESMLRQVRRLASLMDDLLLLARVDARKLALDREVISLSNMVLSLIDDLDAMNDGRVQIKTEVEPDIYVLGDVRYLSIIMHNLIENAYKYTPADGIVRVTVHADSDGFTRLIVANTGAFILPEDAALIFDRFRRGSAIGEATRGHGLGLNIARELALAHGGTVSLIRSDEEWTEFAIILPTANAPSISEPPEVL